MQAIPIKDYVAQFGQVFVAKQLGLTQGAISSMIIKDREVYVEAQEGGRIRAFEVRNIGKPNKAA
jgi:hypothetical protein